MHRTISGVPFSICHDPRDETVAYHVGSTERLAAVVKASVPPRRIECPAEATGQERGRCVPMSIILQLARGGHAVTRSRGPAASDEMRLKVIEFAEKHKNAPWSASNPPEACLGQVIAACTCKSYFKRESNNWKRDFDKWAFDTRWRPEQGCDQGWLFAAAACYGLKVHAYVSPPRELGFKRYVFAAPSSAWSEVIARPTIDVHLGYVEGRGMSMHCVSLPPVWAPKVS